LSLAGGELAIRQPWRVAAALVRDAVGEAAAIGLGFKNKDIEKLLPLLQKPALSPITTSAGRLFDGIAAIVLGIKQCHFEGQAAMLLESACDWSAVGRYDLTIDNTQPRQLDWRPLVEQILMDRANGVSTGTMAMRFHRGLAMAIVEFCSSYRELPVVLGGGVFQNKVLTELLVEEFSKSKQSLGLPGMIPPNDGGLAAGQLVIAAALLKQRRTT
jgi:hydrogenase maturation protein HypF